MEKTQRITNALGTTLELLRDALDLLRYEHPLSDERHVKVFDLIERAKATLQQYVGRL